MTSGTKVKKAAPRAKAKAVAAKAAASPLPGQPGAKPDGVATAPAKIKPVPREILTMMRPLTVLADTTRLMVLAFLYGQRMEGGSITPGALAGAVGIDPEAARAALASLRRIGWVAAAGDGPGRAVRVTDEGLRAYERVSRAFGTR